MLILLSIMSTYHWWRPPSITSDHKWLASVKSPNISKLWHIRRSTRQRRYSEDTHLRHKDTPGELYKRAVFPYWGRFTNSLKKLCHFNDSGSSYQSYYWFRHRSKSHRVPHDGFCFADYSFTDDQLPQDLFNPPFEHTSLLLHKGTSTVRVKNNWWINSIFYS